MECPLKELAKLEKLTDNFSVKRKSSSISDSLDSLLQSLLDVKDRLEAGTETDDTFGQLALTVEARKKEVDERLKEIYSSLSRLGKAFDKVGAVDLWHWKKWAKFTRAEIYEQTAIVFTTIHFRVLRSGT